MAIAMIGCTQEDELVVDNQINTLQKRTFKVLCLGNSFTDGSMGYVPMILKNVAPDVNVTIGIAYIGGCSLQQHLANFREAPFDDGKKEYAPQSYEYRKSGNGAPWVIKRNVRLDAILADDEWDMVTFQQNGAQAYHEWSEVVYPYMSELLKMTEERLPGAKIGWILIHGAYCSSDAAFERNWRIAADNALKTAEAFNCVVFPYGTAVQNLRTTELKELGDGEAHNLNVDDGHLQEGIGCYCAALTNALTILELAGIEDEVDIMEDDTEISGATIKHWNVPGSHIGSGVIGMTEGNRYLAKQAALAAITNPYELWDRIP